ncbi:c-type cytochrome [Kaarinaea lacus]
MAKKLLLTALLLTLPILFLVSACSKQQEPETTPADTQSAEIADAGDSSSNAPTELTNSKPEETESISTMDKKPVDEPTETQSTEAKPQATESEQQSVSTDVAKVDPHQEELSLARKSGCLACHAIDKKVVGPAWRDVSKRYKTDPDAKSKLIAKVSKGGKGNWTDVVGTAAMPPYSPRVSEQNITRLVEFVLSLEQ